LSDATRRVFFALWPDSAQRAALVHATGEVARHCGGRPVPADNLHVTLAFLGAVPESRIACLSSLAQRAAAGFDWHAPPVALTFSSIAHWAKPQILAAVDRAAEGGAGVAALAGILVQETAAAGFTPDLKPFRAHVTVARKVAHAPRESAMQAVEWSFAHFALVESRTLASGPVYSVVESYVLGDAEKLRT
jgi:2'-5' RNA ligase